MVNVWQIPEKFPALLADEAHVWRIKISDFIGHLEKFFALLSLQERQRANRFVFSQDEQSFIIVHGVLRSLLAKYLNIDPKEIRFAVNSHGKPKLVNFNNKKTGFPACAGNDGQINFNISHSHDMALLAFAKDIEIGVDIEYMKDKVNCIDIARRFFSTREAAELAKLPKKEQQQAFFHCWARKEAFIKAIGQGLSFPLRQFIVNIDPDEGTDLLLEVDSSKYQANNWSLIALSVDDQYVAALATANPINILQFSLDFR